MKPKDSTSVKGSFRLQITENGEIVGDSGWRTNQIVNQGFLNFIIGSLSGLAGSSQVGYVAVGTGGAPASNTTIIPSEVTHVTSRQSVTAVTSSNSKYVDYRATIGSSNSYVSAQVAISNIGLYAHSETATSSLFAGAAYTSSTFNTNQDLNITYQIQFS